MLNHLITFPLAIIVTTISYLWVNGPRPPQHAHMRQIALNSVLAAWVISGVIAFIGSITHLHDEWAGILNIIEWIVVFLALCGASAATLCGVIWLRQQGEKRRIKRAKRSGRPYVILPPHKANQMAMTFRFTHGIHRQTFAPEVLEWCDIYLSHPYEIRPAEFSGARVVLFEDENDAFAFKMRWI